MSLYSLLKKVPKVSKLIGSLSQAYKIRDHDMLLVHSGHEIAPNAVANVTKIIVLATKIQKLVAKLETRTLWVLYILP